MFDPWESSLQEALVEQEKHRLRGVVCPLPLRQFIAARGILKSKAAVENGDGLCIMKCMAVCAMHGLVVPVWLATEFCRRVSCVEFGDVVSWDSSQAFGKPHQKGTHQGAERARMDRALQAWGIAGDIRKKSPDSPIDAGFFEAIGEAMVPPMKKTEAEKAYYRAKKMIDENESISMDEIFNDLIIPTNF